VQRAQLPQHDADRVHVDPLVDLLAALLLGGHVRRGAEHAARDREIVAGAVAERALGEHRLLAARQILGEPPVDDDGLAELADDHVGRLEIAVDDLAAVRVGDRVGHGDHVVQEIDALLDGGALADQVAQRPAGHQLHRVERRAVGPAAGLVHGDDAGVLEPRGDQDLALEPRLVDVAARQQLLDRDVAAELAIVGARHPAEAAAAVLAEELVALAVALRDLRRRPRAIRADLAARANWLADRRATHRLVGRFSWRLCRELFFARLHPARNIANRPSPWLQEQARRTADPWYSSQPALFQYVCRPAVTR
jgi:hypothetical protein